MSTTDEILALDKSVRKLRYMVVAQCAVLPLLYIATAMYASNPRLAYRYMQSFATILKILPNLINQFDNMITYVVRPSLLICVVTVMHKLEYSYPTYVLQQLCNMFKTDNTSPRLRSHRERHESFADDADVDTSSTDDSCCESCDECKYDTTPANIWATMFSTTDKKTQPEPDNHPKSPDDAFCTTPKHDPLSDFTTQALKSLNDLDVD